MKKLPWSNKTVDTAEGSKTEFGWKINNSKTCKAGEVGKEAAEYNKNSDTEYIRYIIRHKCLLSVSLRECIGKGRETVNTFLKDIFKSVECGTSK